MDKRSPISATAVLSSYLSTRECICRTVFAFSASASRGTKQRRQLVVKVKGGGSSLRDGGRLLFGYYWLISMVEEAVTV